MRPFWNDNTVTEALARHAAGRKLLNAFGPRFVERKIGRFKLLLDLRDQWGVSKYILKYGNYDPELCRVVKSLIRKDSVCLDLGANIGFWTNFLLSECAVEKVYSFEPEPHNVDLFRRNSSLNQIERKIEFYPMAAGEKAGQLDLYLSDDNAGDHQLYKTGEQRRRVTVQVERIDDLIPERKIDFIKMDVQGFEPFVINGMWDLIDRSPELVLLTEFWPSGIKKAGGDPDKMLALFDQRGFKFHYFDEEQKILRQVEAASIASLIKPDHHIDLFISRHSLGAAP